MRVDGCPWGGEHGHGMGTGVQLGICHMTYGSWQGDVATVANGGLAHFVVGKEEDQWVQLSDTEWITYNVGNWDANQHSVAIEFSGVNEDVLTEWQCRAGGLIVQAVKDAHGVDISYDSGTDGANDVAPWHGWYAHRAIAADNPPQHTDFIDRSEWDRLVNSIGAQPVIEPNKEMIVVYSTTDGHWYKEWGYSLVEISPAKGVKYVAGGACHVGDLHPLELVDICKDGAKAEANLPFWRSKI